MTMNIGALPDDVESFVKRYKELGYSTKTQLIAEALRALRQQKAKEDRLKRREAMLQEYSDSQPEHAWETLDAEDFA
jgi:CO dehydrogenase/acetyl-CoA synthase alpha subunit